MKVGLRRLAPRWYPLWIYQPGVSGYFWPFAARPERRVGVDSCHPQKSLSLALANG